VPAVDLTREEYLQVLGAVGVYAAIEGALRELQGQDMAEAEHPLFNRLLQAAPNFGLEAVQPERGGAAQWVDALLLEYAAILNTYSEAQMWERFAWKLAETAYRRATPAWQSLSREEQFQGAAAIYDRLGEEFTANDLVRVRVPGILD
jgi:hypothetical protein